MGCTASHGAPWAPAPALCEPRGCADGGHRRAPRLGGDRLQSRVSPQKHPREIPPQRGVAGGSGLPVSRAGAAPSCLAAQPWAACSASPPRRSVRLPSLPGSCPDRPSARLWDPDAGGQRVHLMKPRHPKTRRAGGRLCLGPSPGCVMRDFVLPLLSRPRAAGSEKHLRLAAAQNRSRCCKSALCSCRALQTPGIRAVPFPLWVAIVWEIRAEKQGRKRDGALAKNQRQQRRLPPPSCSAPPAPPGSGMDTGAGAAWFGGTQPTPRHGVHQNPQSCPVSWFVSVSQRRPHRSWELEGCLERGGCTQRPATSQQASTLPGPAGG